MSKLFTTQQLKEHIRRRAERAGGMAALARQIGVSRQHLYNVLRSERDVPRPTAKALGYAVERRYRPL